MSEQIALPTLVGLFLIFVVHFILSFFVKPGYNKTGLFFNMVRDWGIVFLLFSITLLWERNSLRSIGFQRLSFHGIFWGFVGFFVGVFSFALTSPLVRVLHLNTTSEGITRLAVIPLWLRIAFVLTAGITEEIMFRGYAIERLATLTGSIGIGAVIAYIVFVAVHLPFWRLGGTIQIGIWSLLVTLLYVWQRNLWPCILMHVLNDAYAFIVLPMFFPKYLAKP